VALELTPRRSLADAVKSWAAGGGYLNYTDRPCDFDAILAADTWARLAEVKRKWDPDDMIRANHAVSVATDQTL
jgi:hypothetical protein